MKDRLKGRLMVLFPKANLSKERLDKILDRLVKKVDENADDTALDAAINEANDLMDFESLARGDDRMRTLEAEAKKKVEGNPPGTPPSDPNPPANDEPAWAKKLFEKIENIEKGTAKDNKRKSVTELFEKSTVLKGLKPELKEKWINRIDLESETPFEDQIKELESEYTDLVQVNADNNDYSGPAGSGSSNFKPDEKEVQDLVDNMVK